MGRDHTVAGLGTAVLAGDVTDDSDSFTIHGVAIGSGDITMGSSGVRKIWPEEALEAAASTLQGKPLVKDHENSVDGVIGRVTKTKFKPGTGVLYEAEISEQFKDVAQKIADGLLEVSVRAYHAPTEELEEDDDAEAKIVEDIVFDNLAVVPQGAAPSNSARAGAAAMMSQDRPQMSSAELRVEFGYDELAFHGPALEAIETFMEREETPDDPTIMDLREWSDSEHLATAISEYLSADDTSEEDSVGSLATWIEDQMDGSDEDNEEDEMFSFTVDDREELAMINGLEINGTVMWGEDQMGVISGFEQEDGALMVEVDVMEKTEEGPFRKTGETVMRPLQEMDESEMKVTRYDRLDHWSEEALQEISVHTPDWSGKTTGSWSEPAMEDFDTDDLGEIDDHFIVSKSGFPPENFTDLALPVVSPGGDLNLSALQNAKARANQVSGLSGDKLSSVESTINSLANENFEDANFGDEEESGQETQGSTDTLNDYIEARIVDDSSSDSKSGTSNSDGQSNDIRMEIEYHTIDGDELDDGHVAVDEDKLNNLAEKAERADKLDDRLDDMNDTLEALSKKTEILDEVDDEDLQSLRDHDDPVVKEKEAYEANMDAVDEVGGVFAELLAEEDSIFSAEELQERHSPLELKAKYEEQLDDDQTIVDQLSKQGDPEPNGEDPSKEELGGGSGEEQAEAKREAFKGRLAEELKSQGKPGPAKAVEEGTSRGEKMVDEYAEKLGVDLE